MPLTTEESEFLRDMVRRDSSIVLDESKSYLLESRLAPIVKTNGLESHSMLVERLRMQPRSQLAKDVVDAMTTNETSFFRDVHPWETLRTTLIPELIEQRQRTRQLLFVCAACSSGQEAYTLAMILKEHFPSIVRDWRVQILANDLSAEMVERTKNGKFSQIEIGRGLPAPMMMKYFSRTGAQWQASDELRSMIDVKQSNLADALAWQGMPRVDLVMMRNVLIYFDRETKLSILGHARRRLLPGGVFMLGSSETMIGFDHGMERRQAGKTVYFTSNENDVGARPAGPAAAPASAGTPGSASAPRPAVSRNTTATARFGSATAPSTATSTAPSTRSAT